MLAAAEAPLSAAHGQLARSTALVDATTLQKQPQVQAAASQLRQAYLNLQRSSIVAPVSGYVAPRQVQLGQRVQPGTTLMTIVPLEQMWVEAKFKENPLTKMHIRQPVEVPADLYGGDVTYHGTTASLSRRPGSALSLLPPPNPRGTATTALHPLPAAHTA